MRLCVLIESAGGARALAGKRETYVHMDSRYTIAICM